MEVHGTFRYGERGVARPGREVCWQGPGHEAGQSRQGPGKRFGHFPMQNFEQVKNIWFLFDKILKLKCV